MAGQPITLTLPTNGDPFATAAPQVVEAITALEVELERKVVPADMSMSADLSFLVAAANYSVTDLLASSYVLNSAALSAATYPRSIYFTGTDGDAYVNDGAGRQIQLTANGLVNNAASGNITSTGSPAYGASSVELRWDGADLEYEMRAGAGADAYADVRLDDVLFNDGSGNFIRLTSPSLASDYTITFPAAVPASTSVVQMSSGGVLSASVSGAIATTGTVATGALTVTGAASVSTGLTVTGDIVVGDDLTVGDHLLSAVYDGGTVTDGDVDLLSLDVGATGITSAGPVTLAVNKNLTLSGTGEIKHGSRTRYIAASSFMVYTGSSATLDTTTTHYWKCANTGSFHFFSTSVPLDVGARIQSVSMFYDGGGSAGTREVVVKQIVLGTDTLTNESTGTETATTGAQIATATTDVAIADSRTYMIFVQLQSGFALNSGDSLKGVEIVYDCP